MSCLLVIVCVVGRMGCSFARVGWSYVRSEVRRCMCVKKLSVGHGVNIVHGAELFSAALQMFQELVPVSTLLVKIGVLQSKWSGTVLSNYPTVRGSRFGVSGCTVRERSAHFKHLASGARLYPWRGLSGPARSLMHEINFPKRGWRVLCH